MNTATTRFDHMHDSDFTLTASTRRDFLRRTLTAASIAAVAPWRGTGAADQPATAAAIEKDLIVHQRAPLNAESALPHLVESWITPLQHFYVRNHGDIPQIDPGEYRLSVEGLVDQPLRLSLPELRERFPSVQTVATLTCAGNRRREFNREKPVEGVQWGAGAIGNARWAGAKLADVLRAAGVGEGAKHVWFEGRDRIDHKGQTISFGGSVPLDKLLTERDDTPGALLAWEMNEQPLAPEHGFPLRTVVPGYIGARSVKWLDRVVVSDRPSPNHYMAEAYKLVTEGTAEKIAAAEPILLFPVNAVICVPEEDATLKTGVVRVRGYALPGGEPRQRIDSVQVSADGGRSWTQARITSPVREHCFVLWQADVRVTDGTETLIVKAIESNGRVQPESAKWNQKGYLFNAPYRVPVRVG